ncbi:putative cDENN domain, tripartite DENN domain, DENN domain lobe protein [Helianthus annuus]|uniref:CDENN domain, tripartite DENN domain-containing protein n=1 Tax=Helianthus annuus TaxID=4232 RepID=A0A9K3NEE5_HELAN|nr:putative cDENN domain, tripartite DENN domain-containing protein [Helianthus annuus]KAJ0539964.1 putative cDENN domain, tripartite DENN domain, DENN domain lobe protein [Helianthus annuus]KAJ0554704.1 putative cDENN domain, tripartite DENN domain, DENN domain lobe protein [Helianthus annuus]KAJ0720268.1 putative cDENN domain, tripartite DENN domain, DENN domain lobe protein [Helianthus annuus]KAJ0723484.1 putative cDENN domain, tripartite DENN domain, DENN domain lobe protein [Helianthus ann
MELYITGNGKVQMSRSNEFKAAILLANHLRESVLYDHIMHFFCKPLWDVITYTLSNIPLPAPGKERVLFGIENTLLSVDFPPKDGLPRADISFQPLVQCLDVDNFMKLFTVVLIERRVLLRSNKYSLLTLASEAICH